jgi:hypothetical protein
MMSGPEPSSVNGPRPRIPRVKIVGHMIELHGPTAMRLPMARHPLEETAMPTRTSALSVTAASRCCGAARRRLHEPRKRPTMAPPQYSVR